MSIANTVNLIYRRPPTKMLSRNLKRALLDSRWPMPPTFLLPWAAGLTTASHSTDPPTSMPPSMEAPSQHQRTASLESPSQASSALQSHSQPPLAPPHSQSSPIALSPSVRELLPILKAQGPHYITAHIHGKPYLLTQGDTVRLPFLMHGVEPGDVLRLNRATHLGSREYTLKAAAARPKLKSPTTDTSHVVEPTSGAMASQQQVIPGMGDQRAPMEGGSKDVVFAPHFIPHIEKGKHSYLDERLFVCRAVVTGVESEPLRIKEKTKRRQRKVKQVKSKHRFTVLRVKEVKLRDLEDVDAGVQDVD